MTIGEIFCWLNKNGGFNNYRNRWDETVLIPRPVWIQIP